MSVVRRGNLDDPARVDVLRCDCGCDWLYTTAKPGIVYDRYRDLQFWDAEHHKRFLLDNTTLDEGELVRELERSVEG